MSDSRGLIAGLNLARQGLRVFPCTPGGKRPAGALVPHGLKDASTDEEIVRGWFEREPDANVAVRTGDGLLVVDVDGVEAWKVWVALLAKHDLTPDDLQTLTCSTPRNGGLHLWFRVPEGVVVSNTAGKLGEGIDTRGDGGYVLVPGSQVGGKPYTWSCREKAAMAPDWLLAAVTRESEPELAAAPVVPLSAAKDWQLAGVLAQFEQDVDAFAAMQPETGRNATYNRLLLEYVRLAQGGFIDERNVVDRLDAAAVTNGTPGRTSTRRSAVAAARAAGPSKPPSKAKMRAQGLLVEPPPARVATIDAPPPSGVSDGWDDFGTVDDEPAVEANGNGQAPVEAGRPTVEYVWLDDDEIAAMPATEFVIDVVLPRNGVLEEYGQRGAGKTFDLLDMARSIVFGAPYHGYEVKRPGNVLYVMAEGSGMTKERIRAWNTFHGFGSAGGRFRMLPRNIRLADPVAFEALRHSIRQMPEKPDVLIIDTLARSMGGLDESSNADMSKVISLIDLIREEFSCAVVLAHHAGWNDEHERGASSLGDAADTIIAMRKSKVDTAGGKRDKVITWELEKLKDHELPPPRKLAFQHVAGTKSVVLVELPDAGLSPNLVNPIIEMRDWIDAQELPLVKDLRARFPMSDDTWRARRTSLEALGYEFEELTGKGRGRPMRILRPGERTAEPLQDELS